jgi:predicted kinase
VHLNPDHFLQTPEGRLTTPERNDWAWTRCFEELPFALASATREKSVLYVLVGAQGSGKSTWARARKELEPNSVIFDAILVKREERAPVLMLAAEHHVPAIAVWFQTSLNVCLARNRGRPPDEVADEAGLCNVYAALEPPSEEEGFASVWLVNSDA